MPEIEKDCFSLNIKEDKIRGNTNYTCNALREVYCAKGKCNFYKSKSEVDIDEINSSIKNYNSKEEKDK